MPKPLPYKPKNDQEFVIKLDSDIIVSPIKHPIPIYILPFRYLERKHPKGKTTVIPIACKGSRKNTEVLFIEGSN